MNSPRFIRFTPAHQPGDVFVRSDAVTSMAEIDYQNAFTGTPPASAPKVTAIGTTGGGTVIVKESPSQVIEALRAAENTHYVTVEYVMDDGGTSSSLADDCECNCGTTCCDDEPDAADYALALEEAQDDAKIADERAEWYKRRAETGDTLLKQGLVEFDKLKADRDKTKGEADELRGLYAAMCGSRDLYMKQFDDTRRERDQLLAKLKDTTAALEKANAELNAARYGKFWSGDVWSRNGLIGNTTGTDPGVKAY